MSRILILLVTFLNKYYANDYKKSYHKRWKCNIYKHTRSSTFIGFRLLSKKLLKVLIYLADFIEDEANCSLPAA